eukprot:TRINITY_DN9327_c0_g1_i1.p1 TRINITY_DN9327_c0_g1~~TRINITY_DN9327_c0_g1_i1.p1  ORF type:complete len:684 (+),score=183.24 TRINITY_DN9327_c0_g1_i1:175-2226(+)
MPPRLAKKRNATSKTPSKFPRQTRASKVDTSEQVERTVTGEKQLVQQMENAEEAKNMKLDNPGVKEEQAKEDEPEKEDIVERKNNTDEKEDTVEEKTKADAVEEDKGNEIVEDKTKKTNVDAVRKDKYVENPEEKTTVDAVDKDRDFEMENAKEAENVNKEEAENVDKDAKQQDDVEEGEDAEADEPQEEMPAPVKERRKQKEFEVFVGGLDKDANEDDLKNVFSKVGEVVEVRLAKVPRSEKNRGFAFVRFATIEQVKRAVTELKNPQVRGKQCGVTRSQDNETLYVRNVCRTWTKEALKNKVKEYGIDNVEELTLVDDPKEAGKNRGFAFLEFNTHLEASNAFKRLQRRDVFLGTNVRAKVAFAESGIEPDEEVMAQVKSIFVDGVPPEWDESQAKEKFQTFGEIEEIQLARNMPKAKRKDFAFISFAMRDAALACMETINKNQITDGEKKLKMKATLRKPRQKNKSAKSVVRGSSGQRAPWVRGVGGFDSQRGGMRGFMGIGNSTARHFYNEYDNRPLDRGYHRRQTVPLRGVLRRDYRPDDFYYDRPISHVEDPRYLSYDDDYGYGGSEIHPQSRMRIPHAGEIYSQRVNVLPGSRGYGPSGSKRPISDLDDVPLYGGWYGRPRIEHAAASADSIYGGSLHPETSGGRTTGVFSNGYQGTDGGARSYPSSYSRASQVYY